MKTLRLTDKEFVYTPAARTDIRKLFKRIRREQEEAAKQTTVTPIKRKAVK